MKPISYNIWKSLFVATLPVTLFLGACDSSTSSESNGDSSSSETNPSSASVAEFEYQLDTVAVDYINNHMAAYLDFSTATITHVPYDTWDIAISNQGVIIANSGVWGSGVRIGKSTQSDMTADLSSEQNLVTEIVDTTSNPFSNELNEQGMGSGAIYLIKDAAGEFYKVNFKSFGPMGKYAISVGKGLNAQTSSEISGSIRSEYGYTYFDLGSATDVTTQMPPAKNWDVKFARALEFDMGGSFSARSAVIFNAENGVEMATIPDTEIKGVLDLQGLVFTQNPYAIGASWYTFDHDSKTYTVNKTTYAFKTVEGNYAKLQMKSFYGPAQEQFWSLIQYGYQADGTSTFTE